MSGPNKILRAGEVLRSETQRDERGAPLPLGTYKALRAEVERVTFRNRKEIHESAQTLRAYVNHGRWVADCECGNGLALDPDWPGALCPACGAEIPREQIVFPDELEKIEDTLSHRKPENQHWRSDEDLAKLKRENRIASLLEGG